MLSLMEEILLLALKEEKGSLSMTASSQINYCLAGAILMELELHQRIKADKKTVQVIDRTPTRNPHLDAALKQIDSHGRLRTPDYWVTKLPRTLKTLRQEILTQMMEKALVREEEHQVFIFFTVNRYPLRDIRAKKDILDRLQKILLRGESAMPRTVKLIGLVSNCGLLYTLFDKEDRKHARKKAKEVTAEDVLSQAVKKALESQSAAST
jgi:hypothetical protein